jgi:hypothetical protein
MCWNFLRKHATVSTQLPGTRTVYVSTDMKRNFVTKHMWGPFLHYAGAHPEFFLVGGGGADPETIYNLCLILAIML